MPWERGTMELLRPDRQCRIWPRPLAINSILKENDWRVFARTTDLVQKLQINRRDLTLEAVFSRLDG
ncbi:hypothetical protein [Jiella pelagia]|jgi:hypothetical protein|uniref:Uncharacterized protein n=2 Tax=Aurantimonadaceae TaxID=255475 RepID=A0ABY7C3S2_9HYPH|nr:hypothetical protein [Jiella pelagia]WAP68465.1 hypothetical protein OH818_24655 [Jiella pelagia]